MSDFNLTDEEIDAELPSDEEVDALIAKESPNEKSTKNTVLDNLDVSPEQTFGLNALIPFGQGKTALSVGSGVAEAVGDIPDNLKKRGWTGEALDHFINKYQRGHKEGVDAFNASSSKNPKAAIAGGVTNAIGTGLLFPGAKGMDRMGKAVQGSRIAAAMGVGNSDADITAEGGAGEALYDGANSSLMGFATANIPLRTMVGAGAGGYLAQEDIGRGDYGKAAAKIAGGAGFAQAAPWLLKKAPKLALSNLLGVNKNAIDDYIARHKEINASPSKSDVKASIDNVVGQARQGILDAKIALKDAKMDHRQDVREAISRAEAALEKAQAQKTMDTSMDIEKATLELKNLLVKGSAVAKEAIPTARGEQQAYQAAVEVLGPRKAAKFHQPQEVGSINTPELERQISKQVNKLSPLGKEFEPTPGAARDSAGRLNEWKAWLMTLPRKLTYEQAKPIIQALDRASAEVYDKPGFSFAPEEQIALARIRQYIDMKLKKGVPEYARRMVNVSDDATLLKGVGDNLGEKVPLQARLNRLPREAQGGPIGDTLDALGRRTNRDFRGTLDVGAEQKAVEGARAASTPRAVSDAVAQSPAGQGVATAEATHGPIARVGRSSESLINRMIRGKETDVQPSLNDQGTVDALSKKIPGLPDWIKNLKTLNAFTGERTNGSRNVVRFGAVGAKMLGPPGAVIGAVTGGVVDKWGPQATKGILNAAIPIKESAQAVIQKLQSNPAMQKYAQPLAEALSKGSDSYAVKYYMMNQMYPDFRKSMDEEATAQ